VITAERRSTSLPNKFRRWFFEGIHESQRKSAHRTDQDKWWKVMCLTGVDYFSTLGYSPGISFLAAGVLSPFATIILVLLTLLGALPIYCKVASESPHGQGSIALLEHLLPAWKGKILVLCLLGFAATDFVITITLSAADAATHLAQNPWIPFWMQNKMSITLFMLALLGAVFLKGFREAIGLSTALVSAYLALNAVVIICGFMHISAHWQSLTGWLHRLFEQHGSIEQMLLVSCLLFPKLALGLSGFETGVAVMPHVSGYPGDNPDLPQGRIKHTKYLLTTAAIIMSFFLIGSALTTTILIPAQEFAPGGAANGRALAYLAHEYLGSTFGTVYDLSTILILWFAGASAMAGLLNLVPRYLPRYGMAPHWAQAVRPLVLFFTAVAFTVTVLFNADVDAQGGAYATGVLVLMTSAALAATLSVWQSGIKKRLAFLTITLIFVYTTITNSFERPDGIKIAAIFIGIILVSSLISRIIRSTELRIQKIALDPLAESFLSQAAGSTVRIVAHRPDSMDYDAKMQEAHEVHNIPAEEIIFLEVQISDASEFGEDELEVTGISYNQYKILRCQSPAVPNAIAALLLFIRDRYQLQPHLYLGWTEGNPAIYILKYLFLGEGETAPVTREILREVEPDPLKRPRVHVG
jgi:hypothetical protein